MSVTNDAGATTVRGEVVREGLVRLDDGRELAFPTGWDIWCAGDPLVVTLGATGTVARVRRDYGELGLTGDEPNWLRAVAARFDELMARGPLTARQRAAFDAAVRVNGYLADADLLRLNDRITRTLAGDLLPINPHDAWAAQAREDLAGMSAADRATWLELLGADASASKPSGAWLKSARARVERLGAAPIAARLRDWFARVTVPPRDPAPAPHAGAPPAPIHVVNADALRALVWAASTFDDDELAGSIGDLAARCFTKIPNRGAMSALVGNACVYTLGQLPGLRAVAQLSRLRARVRYQQGLAQIGKAMAEAARRAGMAPIDLEELAVPTFGLTLDGPSRVELGEHEAELALASGGDGVTLRFFSGGKLVKSVPAAVKTDHAEELKELRTSAKELEAILPGVRARLERWMLEPRTWRLDDLRTRYLDHPVVGPLARALLWYAGDATVLFADGQPRDVTGAALALADDAVLSLWHPLGRGVDEVRAWRERLSALGVTQPFKQAHREIYLLTDAERATETYSNRFAGHVLRQHLFAALARERGWTYHLQGQWDSANTPTRPLPGTDLTVEYWVTAAGEEVTGNFIFQHVSTDQVRFTRAGAPVPLASISARVLSEAMRDVDLFVGVASVGADPTWADQGARPQRYDEYWRGYAFGELAESARTRREALAALLPKLAIRDRLTLEGRFLHVRGTLHTYKIHLGSGNILIAPADRYLCIVPDSSSRADVRLPFQGDTMLSIILSKALLLAADDKIKDASIVNQLRG